MDIASATLYNSEDYLDEESGADMALAIVTVNKKYKDKFDELPKTFQPTMTVTDQIMNEYIDKNKNLMIGGYPDTYIED